MRHFLWRQLCAVLAVLAPLFLLLLGAEGLIRFKTMAMDNYDIEMWRYSRELKERSPDPLLGHDHLPSRTATLQGVELRTNRFGLRGPEVREDHPNRRILFLGSSITLGWGVAESQTMTAEIERRFRESGQDVEVLNAGIGNYNAPRYVHRFLTRLNELKPTDIVVDFFVRDAENLPLGGGNFLLRNSQLAVMLWSRVAGWLNRTSAEEFYGKIYAPDSPDLKAADAALGELAAYGRAHGIRLYLAMIPDMHDLPHYRLGFVHQVVQEMAVRHGFRYVDLYPSVQDLPPERIWVMPGDPHPNATGHARMAERLFPLLAGTSQ